MRRSWSWWPLLLIGLGLILLLDNLGFNVTIRQFWPVLLIIMGLSMLMPRRPRVYQAPVVPPPPPPPPAPDGEDQARPTE